MEPRAARQLVAGHAARASTLRPLARRGQPLAPPWRRPGTGPGRHLDPPFARKWTGGARGGVAGHGHHPKPLPPPSALTSHAASLRHGAPCGRCRAGSAGAAAAARVRGWRDWPTQHLVSVNRRCARLPHARTSRAPARPRTPSLATACAARAASRSRDGTILQQSRQLAFCRTLPRPDCARPLLTAAARSRRPVRPPGRDGRAD